MDIVVFDVGGKLFKINRSTFSNANCDDFLPKLISNKWKKDINELPIFIDRNPKTFQYILDYYRTNVLCNPPHIDAELWKAECQFYFPTSMIEEVIENDKNTEKSNNDYDNNIRKSIRYFLINIFSYSSFQVIKCILPSNTISITGKIIPNTFLCIYGKWWIYIYNNNPCIYLGHEVIRRRFGETEKYDDSELWIYYLDGSVENIHNSEFSKFKKITLNDTNARMKVYEYLEKNQPKRNKKLENFILG